MTADSRPADPSHSRLDTPIGWAEIEPASERELTQQERLGEGRVLSWRELEHPHLRESFWNHLWDDVCALRVRYRLPVRARWFEEDIQVEALAALAAWVRRYDSGDWEDPPGKLSLLFELERVEALLRDGHDPLDPERDRAAFVRFVARRGFERGDGVG
jgi:hypothetical protein